MQPKYSDGGWYNPSRFVWEPGDLVNALDTDDCPGRYPGCNGWKRKTQSVCGYCAMKKQTAINEDDGA